MENQNNNLSEQHTSASLVKRWLSIILLLVIVSVIAFRAGYSSGREGLAFSPKDFKIINQNDQTATVDYNLFWEALRVVQQKYIDKGDIDQQKILYGAIDGAVAAAGDEYTEFFDPEELKAFRTELRGSFEGIGAEINRRNNSIVIVAPLEDTPADRAGLLPKDVILQIDGQSTADMTVEQAVNKIRGQKGTQVTLSIFREGRTQPFEVKITRETISVRSVKLEFRQVGSQQIAVLTLSRFGDDTRGLFDRAVSEILSRKADRLVLDLRNNPGGYLESSVEIASYWVPKGQLVVNEAHSEKQNTPYNSYGYNRLNNIKTVALINGGSASAAEILAGALRDHNLARLIGEKSFGKGSVQELVDLSNGTALKITVAKWITPGGKNLNQDGLNPDIEVKRTEEDIANDRDPQLDKALEEVAK
jgi:carboxyl-terminal processing protease